MGRRQPNSWQIEKKNRNPIKVRLEAIMNIFEYRWKVFFKGGGFLFMNSMLFFL